VVLITIWHSRPDSRPSSDTSNPSRSTLTHAASRSLTSVEARVRASAPLPSSSAPRRSCFPSSPPI
jgi:hypothetical protein